MSSRALSGFESFVGGLLRDGDAGWPEAWRGEAETKFLALAEDHGVEALIYARLRDRPDWPHWPSDVRAALKTRSQLAAAGELLRRAEVERLLAHLQGAGLRPLLFKGTPLAYSHYPAPALRPRWDTDLLLPTHDRARLLDAMSDLGYRPQLSIPGDAVLPQSLFVGSDEKGLSHAFDVHWKISNAPAFADKLSYEELLADATPVPRLGPAAYTPNRIFALLIACLHRAAHHFNCNRLIWLYDMHLLAGEMEPGEPAAFARMAFDKAVAAVCLDGLRVTQEIYGTGLPDGFMEEFAAGVANRPAEATQIYLAGARSRGERLWRDVRASHGPLAALRLLREHLLPPPSYMLKRYNTTNRSLLPVLYTRRVVQGIPKLFRRAG